MGYKNVKYGRNRIRRNYSRVQTNVELPNLIEVQTKSFEWFTTKGLQDLFAEFSPIKDHGGNLELYFDNFEFDEPKYTIPEAKRNDMNYSRPLKADVMLKSNETGEIKQDKIFLGEFPMMTPWGTFVINGAERVVVTQIIRSAGAFFNCTVDKKSGQKQFYGQIIPTRGAWIEFETGSKDIWYAKLDRSKKICLTTFLRAIGLNSNRDITKLFGNNRYLQNTFLKDLSLGSDDALEELYEKIRPGEKANPESARNYLASRLFDNRRYDLASVGRYKVNKKLDVLARLSQMLTMNAKLVDDITDPETGEVVFVAQSQVTEEMIDYLSTHRNLILKKYEYEQMMDGSDHVMLETIEVEYDLENSKNPKAFLLSNIKELSWINYSAKTGKQISAGKLPVKTVNPSNNNEQGITSFASVVASKITTGLR